MAGNYIVSKIRMRDIHVYLFETVDNVKFEKIKYNKSQFWSPYIYNLKVSLFCLFLEKLT